MNHAARGHRPNIIPNSQFSVNASPGIGSVSIPRRRFLLDGHFGRFDYGEYGISLSEVHPLDRAGCDNRSHRPSGSVDDNFGDDLVRYNLLNRAG